MKDMIKRIREEREGFTLAELLIVVAIIAVLVAIAIPVFNAQLEKSREAVDAANIRAAYAEIMADAVTGKDDTTKTVKLKQETADWQNDFDFPVNLVPAAGAGAPTPKQQDVTLSYDKTNQNVTINIKVHKAA